MGSSCPGATADRPVPAALRTDGLRSRPLSAADAATYRPTTDSHPGGPVPEEQDVETLDIQDGVVEETLVEEVSIDGMCGVY
jgi:mycofactocin precursor